MALLLRMGGVPARVSTGFTSGSLDAKTREFVVRDLDAHSWVEVWYRDIGWVTFDPTPADAPPRAQPNEGGDDGPISASAGPPSLGGGDRPADPGRRAAAVEESTWWGWYVLGGIAAVLLLVAALLIWRGRRRRRGTPPAAVMLGELERALYRTRRHPGAGTTLSGLETLFARSPAAAGYVRAVRELRYGGRPVAPDERPAPRPARRARPRRRPGGSPARVVGLAAASVVVSAGERQLRLGREAVRPASSVCTS